MIDISVLRDEPDTLKARLLRRGITLDVDAMVTLDVERRQVRVDAENLRAEQKKSGQAISSLEGEEKQAAIARAGALSRRVQDRAWPGR